MSEDTLPYKQVLAGDVATLWLLHRDAGIVESTGK